MKHLACAALLAATPVAAQGLPPSFVRVADLVPGAIQDVRYAGSDNFTGHPVPGYVAADCWLLRTTAEALAKVQAGAQARGLRLVLWDCYRPQRATDAFVRWAADATDQTMKARYYPAMDKATLFDKGYIGRYSAHSTGTTVDLGLATAAGAVLDFGSPFDLFDPKSAMSATGIPAAARANRALLKTLMTAQGFHNYPREWWHYTFAAAGRQPAWDVPIAR